MIGPALEEIADNLSDQLTVAGSISTTTRQHPLNSVRGIPTLMLLKTATSLTKVGALPKVSELG